MSMQVWDRLPGQWRVPLVWLAGGLGGLVLAWLVMRQPTIGSLLALAVVVIVLLLGIALFFRRDGALSFRRVLLSLLVVAILFPYIRLPAGIPDVRLELVIVLAAWGLLFLGYLATNQPIRLRRCPAYKWFVLFGFSIAVSMVYASFLRGQPLIGRDFWELAKLLQYVLTFALVASLSISPASLKRYYKLALVVLLLSALFGFLQYIDFAGINRVVSPYYAPTQMRALLWGRVTGTTFNPNQFGALMVLAASLALSGGLFFQERRLRMLSWSGLPVFSLALLLSFSRTSLVALFVAGVTVLFLFLRQTGLKHGLKRVAGFALAGCIVGVLIWQVVPERGVLRFAELQAFTEARNWTARVSHWETQFGLWRQSLLLGWGPGKATMPTVVDNEWLRLLRRYGLVGTTVFVGLLGSLYLGLSHICRGSSELSVIALSVALRGTLVGYALYMMLAPIYGVPQLVVVLMLLLGLAYSQWRPRRTTVGGEA